MYKIKRAVVQTRFPQRVNQKKLAAAAILKWENTSWGRLVVPTALPHELVFHGGRNADRSRMHDGGGRFDHRSELHTVEHYARQVRKPSDVQGVPCELVEL